MILIDCRLMWS